jgi:hypothetical protein
VKCLVEPDTEAERIRSLVLLRASCETAIDRLNEDDLDDLDLAMQIQALCDSLDRELDRFANRRTSN